MDPIHFVAGPVVVSGVMMNLQVIVQ